MTPDPFRPWDMDACAEWLGVSKSFFQQAIRYVEGFPAPLAPYTYNLNGSMRTGRPEWAGIDVMTWRLGEERITRFLREAHEKPNKINE